MRNLSAWALVALISVLGCGSKGSGTSPGGSGSAAAGAGGRIKRSVFPVEVQPVKLQQLDYTVPATGVITAFQQVQITARVAGAVDKVGFKEGEAVKDQQVLVVIDASRYQVAVNQAQAALQRAIATEAGAKAQYNRRVQANAATGQYDAGTGGPSLIPAGGGGPGLISTEEVEQYRTTWVQAQSDTAAARASLVAAQLNQRDSSVRAPMTGIVQTRQVQMGQYVNTGQLLGTLLQQDPLLLNFNVTEDVAPRLKPGTVVTFAVREKPDVLFHAKVTLVAGSANLQSHLVPIVGEVIKDETKTNVMAQYGSVYVRPGAFCQVQVPIKAPAPAVVVPNIALLPTEFGYHAFVVQDGPTPGSKVAKLRTVTVGEHTADGQMIEIRPCDAGAGCMISPGEMLVVRGNQPLDEGVGVTLLQGDAGAAGAGATP